MFKNHVFCCVNSKIGKKCCADANAQSLRNYMKVRAKELGIEDCRINNSGCLDRCSEGPVLVIYPQSIWYRYENKEDIDKILNSLIDDKIVQELAI